MPNVSFPLQVDASGQLRQVSGDANIEQLIEQLLFLSPGERVNRPDLGCGLARLVFDPNSPELATATQFLVQGALQQWLGHLITVQSVILGNNESQLSVTVTYTVKAHQTTFTRTFFRSQAR